MVALPQDDADPFATLLGPVHAPWDRKDPARPLSWGDVEEVVTPELLHAAIEQTQIIKATGALTNIAGRTNDTRTNVIGKLGELVVARYYRRCGLDVDLAAFRGHGAGFGRYDHERDRYDLLVSGWRQLEVKTVKRTVKAQPHYVAHLNRHDANIRREDLFCFCSFYTRENDEGEREDVVQYMGWLSGGDILRFGTFYRKGECAPLDGGFPQRADNYIVRYDSLHHPHWLSGNNKTDFASMLQEKRALAQQPFSALRHVGVEEE